MAETIRFSNLDVKIEAQAGYIQYSFSGDIDEYFDYKKVPVHRSPKIVFDLENIRNINSIGIREWVSLINNFRGAGDVVYRKCSIAVVDQFNMVPASIGNAHIESVFAPYFCPSHGETNQIIATADYVEGRGAPEFLCQDCGEPLEFDSLEETYFMFASGRGMKNAS